jgi:hypothetical protein
MSTSQSVAQDCPIFNIGGQALIWSLEQGAISGWDQLSLIEDYATDLK